MAHSSLIEKPAPALSLPDANGETYNLTPESAGVPIVIFFYPKSGAYLSSPFALLFANTHFSRFIWLHQGGLRLPRCLGWCVHMLLELENADCFARRQGDI